MHSSCGESPFLLANEVGYQQWRRHKLDERARCDPQERFFVHSNGLFPSATMDRIGQQLRAFGFIHFESRTHLGKQQLLALCRQFGLSQLDSNPGSDDDSITSLRVVDDTDDRSRYIPYTNRALGWHTDGYYNTSDRLINAFALYCVQPAARGGKNFLLDHEMVYLLIRDRSAALIDALMQPDMMTVPANLSGQQLVRQEQQGPVFSINPGNGKLHMRFTSRPRHINWKKDPLSERAIAVIQELLRENQAASFLHLDRHQGLICRNLLHGRKPFHDEPRGPSRLYYRARFYDPIHFADAAADTVQ